MSNIDANAQTELNCLQNALTALQTLQTSMATIIAAMPSNGPAGIALVRAMQTAVEPFNQRFTDMANAITDASAE